MRSHPKCSVVTLCVATITTLAAVALVGIAFRFAVLILYPYV